MEFKLPALHNSAIVKASNKFGSWITLFLLYLFQKSCVSNILLNCLNYTTSDNLGDRYTQGHKDY